MGPSENAVYQYISSLCEYSNREDDDNDDQPGPNQFQGLPGLQRVWRGTTWLQPMGARPGHSEDSTDEKWGWVKLHMESYGFTIVDPVDPAILG
jgi:hypothetical protein